MTPYLRIIPCSLLLAGSLLLTGCNSDSGGDSPAPVATGAGNSTGQTQTSTNTGSSQTQTGNTASRQTIRGVAATGAPIVGGTVTARCAAGNELSTSTTSDGSYTLAITNQVAPCVLEVAGGTINGKTNSQKLHSAATTTDTVANITPLTELALADITETDPTLLFGNLTAELTAKLTAVALAEVQTSLKAQLAALRDAASEVDIGDFFTGSLQAGNPNNPMDAYLDDLGKDLEQADIPLAAIVSILSGNGTLGQIVETILNSLIGNGSGSGSASATART